MSHTKLDKAQVLKLAHLSRLTLTDEEVDAYLKDLNDILDYIEKLNAIDTDGLEPTYQVSGLTNVMRNDEVKSYQAATEDLLAGTPRSRDQYIEVNRMI